MLDAAYGGAPEQHTPLAIREHGGQSNAHRHQYSDRAEQRGGVQVTIRDQDQLSHPAVAR